MTASTRNEVNLQSPSTPSKRQIDFSSPPIVTPSLQSPSAEETKEEEPKSARRNLAAKRLYFGHTSSCEDTVKENTRQVYKVVRKMSGTIGGNGCGGAIYGELTIGSMQKVVELMKVHTNFGPKSRFIDVGSGLGKPNLHVAQDPGVEFSYGIEMEKVRWVLGMSNLNMVLKHAKKKPQDDIRHRCMFQYGDITEAKYFDPFTHVYMFDIGFPPRLFKQLSEMFNRSESPYLICYHGPRLMIDRYGFDVELIVQSPTSMHGSSEGHMGYIYRRIGEKKDKENQTPSKRRSKPTKKDCRVLLDGNIPSDPLFVDAWNSTRQTLNPLLDEVKSVVSSNLSSERPRRKRNVVAK